MIQQMQGCEFAAAAWETEVLPRRIANYQPEFLDELCLSGEVSWGRLSPHPAFERETERTRSRRVRPTRVAPLAIFLREDSPLAAGHAAAFAARIAVAPGARSAGRHRDARRVVLRRPHARHRPARQRSGGRAVGAGGRRPGDGRRLRKSARAARSASGARGRQGPRARPRHAPGRWALLRHAGAAADGHAETFARQLLARWGVVFRDVAVARDAGAAWRDLLVVLRRMESRGEIRGGRFVAAFIGEQFALPEALDALRAIRRSGETAEAPEDVWSVQPAPDPSAAVGM